jgi:hypothetical protein
MSPGAKARGFDICQRTKMRSNIRERVRKAGSQDELRTVIDVPEVELVIEEIARINRDAAVRAELLTFYPAALTRSPRRPAACLAPSARAPWPSFTFGIIKGAA